MHQFALSSQVCKSPCGIFTDTYFFLVFWVLSVPVGIHPCGLTSFPRWLLMLSTCDTPPIPPYIFFGSMPIKGPLPMCEAWYLGFFFLVASIYCKNFLWFWGISFLFHLWFVNIFSYVVDYLLFCHFLWHIKLFFSWMQCHLPVQFMPMFWVYVSRSFIVSGSMLRF